MKTMLIAVGGNSLIRAGEKGTVGEQRGNARRTAAAIIEVIRRGYRLIITHGNGPQVGAALLRSERTSDQVPPHTLDVCGAATQGEIGYLLAQALHDELALHQLDIPVVGVVTQCLVSTDDPAMRHPTKPIGPFYSKADAEERRRVLMAHRGRCRTRVPSGRAFSCSGGNHRVGSHPRFGERGCSRHCMRRRGNSGGSLEQWCVGSGSRDR